MVAPSNLKGTHTFAYLPISEAAYNEIKAAFEEAGYGHAFLEDRELGTVIDMHGVALARDSSIITPADRRIESLTRSADLNAYRIRRLTQFISDKFKSGNEYIPDRITIKMVEWETQLACYIRDK